MTPEPYYAGATIPFSFEEPIPFTNVVAYFVRDTVIIEKFAYPILVDHQLLSKVGSTYSGVLLGANTECLNTGSLSIEIKAFINGTWEPIGANSIQRIQHSTVAKVRLW